MYPINIRSDSCCWKEAQRQRAARQRATRREWKRARIGMEATRSEWKQARASGSECERMDRHRTPNWRYNSANASAEASLQPVSDGMYRKEVGD